MKFSLAILALLGHLTKAETIELQAEADLMILIAKNPPLEGEDEESSQRHLNVVKNKLSGWHGTVTCRIDIQKARYLP